MVQFNFQRIHKYSIWMQHSLLQLFFILVHISTAWYVWFDHTDIQLQAPYHGSDCTAVRIGSLLSRHSPKLFCNLWYCTKLQRVCGTHEPALLILVRIKFVVLVSTSANSLHKTSCHLVLEQRKPIVGTIKFNIIILVLLARENLTFTSKEFGFYIISFCKVYSVIMDCLF